MILTRVLSAVIPLLDDDADASGVCGATEDEAKPSLRRLLPHCPHWPLHVLLHGSPHSPDPNSEACIRKAEALRTRKPHSYTRKSKPETTHSDADSGSGSNSDSDSDSDSVPDPDSIAGAYMWPSYAGVTEKGRHHLFQTPASPRGSRDSCSEGVDRLEPKPRYASLIPEARVKDNSTQPPFTL
eukprot:3294024-Rhodomonas_salina.1